MTLSIILKPQETEELTKSVANELLDNKEGKLEELLQENIDGSGNTEPNRKDSEQTST